MITSFVVFGSKSRIVFMLDGLSWWILIGIFDYMYCKRWKNSWKVYTVCIFSRCGFLGLGQWKKNRYCDSIIWKWISDLESDAIFMQLQKLSNQNHVSQARVFWCFQLLVLSFSNGVLKNDTDFLCLSQLLTRSHLFVTEWYWEAKQKFITYRKGWIDKKKSSPINLFVKKPQNIGRLLEFLWVQVDTGTDWTKFRKLCVVNRKSHLFEK